MADALSRLLAEERLPESYRAIIDRYWRPMAERLASRQREAGGATLVGINGAQGTGKTTLCRILDEVLLPELGIRSAVLSLDDLYLPNAERQRLAREVHPLLATRGVPGTHDVALGVALIDRPLAGSGPVRMPRFSKAEDDRIEDRQWPTVEAPVDILLFEGWCVGARPQDAAALADPVNDLEAREDPDGAWRRYVNDQLAGPYRALFDPIDLLVMLRPPDFEAVIANRRLQEEKLRASGGSAVMDEAALLRFIQHYERLTRHMFATLPDRAEILVDFNRDRQVTQLRLQSTL